MTAGSDLDDLVELIHTIQIHDRIPNPMGRSDLQELLSGRYVDPARDLRMIRDDGALVAWALVSHWPSEVVRERVRIFGGVHPAARERGLGSELLQWGERRARERLSVRNPELEWWLLADALEWQADQRSLLERHGFDEVRWFIDMKRSLREVPEPATPRGIEIVPWAPEHSAAVREVSAAAFADHWGSTPMTEHDWAEMLREQCVRLDLSFVAFDGDRIVGYSRNEFFPESDPEGERIAWVGHLGTLREYRRRGIAGALLDHSHRRFAEAGFTHAMLDVDADSPTGAGAIYERHGYRPTHRTVVALKVLKVLND